MVVQCVTDNLGLNYFILMNKFFLVEITETNPVVNPQAFVAHKSATELVFRRFQGEEVDFYIIGFN